ncbi:ras GEF, partial [Ramicandelaber brevisporus]
GQVVSGTLTGLIEALTPHNVSVNKDYFHAFLLTFRGFCTPVEFINHLRARFGTSPPDDLSPNEIQVWSQKWLMPVRLRVQHVVKSWLDSYFFEDEDASALPLIADFVNIEIRAVLPGPAERMNRMVISKITEADLMSARGAAPARLARSKTIDLMLTGVAFIEIHPIEIARQLTLMDSKLFLTIRPHELLGQEFIKPAEVSTATNVRAMVAASTRISHWVIVTILMESDHSRRLANARHFVDIAHSLLQMNNFNTMFAIMAGLQSASVDRLKQSVWQPLSSAITGFDSTLKKLNEIIDVTHNYSGYRKLLKNTEFPAMPFLGLYLSDLTFTDHQQASGSGNGNGGNVEPTIHINFVKFQRMVSIIQDFQAFQIPYSLTPVHEVQSYL